LRQQLVFAVFKISSCHSLFDLQLAHVVLNALSESEFSIKLWILNKSYSNFNDENEIYLPDIVCRLNIIPADALSAFAARASAGMILTCLLVIFQHNTTRGNNCQY